MSFMDSRLVFWDNQALTASEESRTAGNMFDMEEYGAVDSQLGFVWWNLLIGTAEDGSCANGGYFQLVTSDSATFASGGSGASTAKTGAVMVLASIGSAADPLFSAELQSGKQFSVAIPVKALMRYVQVEWIGASSAGAMTVDSWLGMEPLSELNIQKEPT